MQASARLKAPILCYIPVEVTMPHTHFHFHSRSQSPAIWKPFTRLAVCSRFGLSGFSRSWAVGGLYALQLFARKCLLHLPLKMKPLQTPLHVARCTLPVANEFNTLGINTNITGKSTHSAVHFPLRRRRISQLIMLSTFSLFQVFHELTAEPSLPRRAKPKASVFI